jgi:hypothetical protein
MSDKDINKESSSQVIEHTETSKQTEQMRKKLDEMGAALLKEGKPLNDPALFKQANLVKASLDEGKLGAVERAVQEEEQD